MKSKDITEYMHKKSGTYAKVQTKKSNITGVAMSRILDFKTRDLICKTGLVRMARNIYSKLED